MKNKMTELIFILDKSGSMSGLENDTIGGFNNMLKQQKAEEGSCRIMTVLFDHEYSLLHDRRDIRLVPPITNKEYFVGGSTALLDAIGKTIHRIRSFDPIRSGETDQRKVLFVIITDGEENASRQFTREHVRDLVETQQSAYGWKFIFLGANIDAITTARDFGIPDRAAQNFHADSRGAGIVFEALSGLASEFRSKPSGTEIKDDWKKSLTEDFQNRESDR